MRSILAILSAVLLSACPRPRCVEGEMRACACRDGRRGAQTCNTAGSFAPCVCEGDGGACTPECGARECGPDPACGASCGTCAIGSCDVNGRCAQLGTICVAGDAFSCAGADESWTGTECCVDRASVCVGGDFSSCSGSSERWTGSSCCIVGTEATCVGGTSSSCSGTNEIWTGTECCITGRALCVTGDFSWCSDTSEHWTGTQCCVTDAVDCVSGDSASCSGAAEHWTGTLCCLTP